MPELPQEREGPACGARAREVKVDGELTVPAQMPGTGGVEEGRQLRQAAAAPPRRDRGELVPQVLRE